jgi:hypothetical protein
MSTAHTPPVPQSPTATTPVVALVVRGLVIVVVLVVLVERTQHGLEHEIGESATRGQAVLVVVLPVDPAVDTALAGLLGETLLAAESP